MSDEPVAMTSNERNAEAGSLGREMALAYRAAVGFYCDQMGLDPAEAHAMASEPADAAGREQLLAGAPDQVSWLELSTLAAGDPDAAQALWTRIKAEARAELANGHRAARALEVDGLSHPWDRARFLAIRRAFRDEWQSRGGIEDMLLDSMAQAYTQQTYWTARLHERANLEASKYKDEGRWTPPRVTDAEAIDQAAQMVDRFNRVLLRTLRALRDQRRYGPVVVQQAGQVNVAERQVNVAR